MGARNAEFFNWGLQGTGGGRLQELRAEIDAGRPVPLGLKSLDADPSNDHVVLAIGYDMGRYRGDLGANKEDLKIFIYDPNSGNRKVALYPVPSEAKYCMDGANGTKCFRTYFVMKNAWTPQTPPAISDHPKELILTVIAISNMSTSATAFGQDFEATIPRRPQSFAYAPDQEQP